MNKTLMKKTLIAAGVALALGAAGPAQAATFTPVPNGSYYMTITGGCFGFSNCVTGGTGALTDNTTAAEASVTTTTTIGVTPPGTYGSGIVGDGLMGKIGFTLNNGTMSVTSFSQDSYLKTAGGTFYLDTGTNGTAGMTGSIGSSGKMTFTPTGRMGLAAGYISTLGHQPWNLDDATGTTTLPAPTGLYTPFTTATSANRTKGISLGFSLTGTALTNAGLNDWTGTLVSAGNIGSSWGSFNNQPYAEQWKVNIAPVPIPAAAWLFGSGLLGLVGVARRRNRKS